MDVDLLEMGQIVRQHLDQRKPYGRVVGESDSGESAVRLRFSKVALARRPLERRARSVVAEQRRRGPLDRPEAASMSRGRAVVIV